MSRPSRSTRPELGCSKPAISRKVVVLPHPDGPSSEKNPPDGISRSMASTAASCPKCFVSETRLTCPVPCCWPCAAAASVIPGRLARLGGREYGLGGRAVRAGWRADLAGVSADQPALGPPAAAFRQHNEEQRSRDDDGADGDDLRQQGRGPGARVQEDRVGRLAGWCQERRDGELVEARHEADDSARHEGGGEQRQRDVPQGGEAGGAQV